MLSNLVNSKHAPLWSLLLFATGVVVCWMVLLLNHIAVPSEFSTLLYTIVGAGAGVTVPTVTNGSSPPSTPVVESFTMGG
jgi:hypothetical protein